MSEVTQPLARLRLIRAHQGGTGGALERDMSTTVKKNGFRITSALVRALVLARMESDIPDEILAALKPHDGKPLTVRHLALLPGGAERWMLHKHAGMISIEERDYRRTQGSRGTSLLVAYSEKNVIIDCAFLVEKNPAYFVARVERNAKRQASLANLGSADLANRINAVIQAREELSRAEAHMSDLTNEYGTGSGAFSPDRYAFEALAEGDAKKADTLLSCHGLDLDGSRRKTHHAATKEVL